MDRLFASAKTYHLEMAYAADQLTAALFELVTANGFKDCYIRPTVYFDAGSLGIRAVNPVSVTILAWEWASDFAAKQEHGMRLTLSPWRKFHPTMMPTTAKACGQYLNSILAVREAAARGFDEALLLNAEGNVAEGAVENVFVIKNGKVKTNDETSSILLGITRLSAIELARHLGYEVEIGVITLDEVKQADEMFLTGTAIEITPVSELDGQPIGHGGRGPITAKIQQAYFDAVRGRLPEFAHWLTPVPMAAMAKA
jgi:branched-chain amino acid aminotransferase